MNSCSENEGEKKMKITEGSTLCKENEEMLHKLEQEQKSFLFSL